MSILDYIPVGHANAVTSRDISRWAGITTREARRQISVARRDTVILNMQDGMGYFIPNDEEGYLVNEWVKQEESRLKVHAMSLRSARRWVKDER